MSNPSPQKRNKPCKSNKSPDYVWKKRKRTLLTKVHAFLQDGEVEIQGQLIREESQLTQYVSRDILQYAKEQYLKQQVYNLRHTDRIVQDQGEYRLASKIQTPQKPAGYYVRRLTSILYNPQSLSTKTDTAGDRTQRIYEQLQQPDVLGLVGTREYSDGKLEVRLQRGPGWFSYIWERPQKDKKYTNTHTGCRLL